MFHPFWSAGWESTSVTPDLWTDLFRSPHYASFKNMGRALVTGREKCWLTGSPNSIKVLVREVAHFWKKKHAHLLWQRFTGTKTLRQVFMPRGIHLISRIKENTSMCHDKRKKTTEPQSDNITCSYSNNKTAVKESTWLIHTFIHYHVQIVFRWYKAVVRLQCSPSCCLYCSKKRTYQHDQESQGILANINYVFKKASRHLGET